MTYGEMFDPSRTTWDFLTDGNLGITLALFGLGVIFTIIAALIPK